ncbi:MAG: hypothetical protein LUQ17_01040, partial [Methanomicrobiales archaeon]|nr:hypothetical protein [Methanomicrobiales archaeon]
MARTELCWSVVMLLTLLIPAACGAIVPDHVIIDSTSNWVDDQWVLAGGPFTSTISVTVTNLSSSTGKVGVRIWVDNPLLGDIPADNQNADIISGTGSVSFTFIPGTTSGNATIRAEITDLDTGNQYTDAMWNDIIRIDHDVPKYFKIISYPSNITVGSNLTIRVQLSDKYGNIVENKRNHNEYSESIVFFDSSDGNSTFWDNINYVPGIHYYKTSIDTAGFASIGYRVPTTSGDNVIQVNAPYGVVANQTNSNYTWISITGTADTAITLSSIIRSDTDTYNATADGHDKFYIYYLATDKYSNPVSAVLISWSSDRGENRVFT